MKRAELEDLAEELGVMPEEGSGVDGSVLVEDIEAAIEAVQEVKAPPVPKVMANEFYKNGAIGLEDVIGQNFLDEGKVYELPMALIIKIRADNPHAVDFV